MTLLIRQIRNAVQSAVGFCALILDCVCGASRCNRCTSSFFLVVGAIVGWSHAVFAETRIIIVPAWSDEAVPGSTRKLTLSDALVFAREVREQDKSGSSIIIEMSPGVHRLSQTVKFTARDSGTPDDPLIIRGAAGAVVRLSGSRPVFPKNIEVIPSAPSKYFSSLPAIARSKVRIVHLNENELRRIQPRGLTFLQRIAPIEAYQIGQPLKMARWPKGGFAKSMNVTVAATTTIGPQFRVPFDKASVWNDARNLWAGGYWANDWYFESVPVSAIDSDQGMITVFPLRANYPARSGFRYFIYNALSELNAPGDYFVDWEARQLIVWPYDDDLGQNPIEIAKLEQLIDMDGINNVRFEGIIFENARGDAIRIRDSDKIEIENSVVRNVGGNGIVVEGGKDVHVIRSSVANTGESGIILSGGDRDALIPSNHAVRDSIIVRFGRLGRSYRPGVELRGVGQIVEGSYLADGPHAAILFQGNDHRITHNEISRVLQETSDAGAIYAGRDWTARGTEISENYFHDISPMLGEGIDGHPYEVKGIYLDDMLSGTRIRRNLFINVARPVFIGGGRDNDVSANIFINPINAAIHVDDRGLNWASYHVADTNGSLRKSLLAVPYQSEPYQSRYPGLANILEDEPGAPKNNHIGPNIVLGGLPYEISPSVTHLQQFGPVIDERTVGNHPLSGKSSTVFSLLADSSSSGITPPFDLPLLKMDRRCVLKRQSPFMGSLLEMDTEDGRC